MKIPDLSPAFAMVALATVLVGNQPLPVPSGSSFQRFVEAADTVDTAKQTVAFGGTAYKLVGIDPRSGDPRYIEILRARQILMQKDGRLVVRVMNGRFSHERTPGPTDLKRWQQHFG